MRTLLLAVGVLALVAAIGCSRVELPPTTAAAPPSAAGEKKLPIVVLKYGFQPDRTVCLEGPYGFLIRWYENEPPRFYVYDTTRWSIDTTGDFEEFLRLLSAFPDGAKVRWMSTCCAPTCWAMPEENRKEIAKLIEAKRWNLYEGEEVGHSIFCTCESRERVFLEKAP